MYVDLSTNVPHYLTQFGQKGCQGCYWLPFASGHSPAPLCPRMLLYTRTTLAYKGYLLGCDYSLFYGIFPLPYCKVLLAKTSETIIIQTISVLFCVYDIGG